ncbi:MAG: glycosyltransferase [Pseudodesulfovibrio sp.]|uniref:glycosyltransferase n=1 Tax=Pseudodesulfovibrio sp. TaxID=2035812 RepID=UPI003D0E2AE1
MDGNKPLVTVLVPSYNHGRYIRERIESVVRQTYPHVELFVIDDCSRDQSDGVIRELQGQYGFKYLCNTENSGSPFSAWERIRELAQGDFIWICESDDVAEPEFLETAVRGLTENDGAVLFYSSSKVIDENGETVGHTNDYFHEVWKETRWDGDFVNDGPDELARFQLRGQTVPNMSSALISAEAFRAALTPFLTRLRLTGDWLFVGNVMRRGRVVYDHRPLNRFRTHAVTSRAQVDSARSQAEFLLTKYILFRGTGRTVSTFAPLMASDVARFLDEPAGWREVLRALCRVSCRKTMGCLAMLFVSTLLHPGYIKQFFERFGYYKGQGAKND